jgi:hypothetical protein
VDIYVKSGHEVDSYFHLPMSKFIDGWRKVWFFLRNGADALLPMFMGSRLIPQPNWGYEVASRDLRKLQSLRKVIQQLWWEGLTGVNLLRTFFQSPDSTTPSMGDYHMDVIDMGPCSWGRPRPLREGVDTNRVSLLAFTFGSLHSLICSLCSCSPIGSSVCL